MLHQEPPAGHHHDHPHSHSSGCLGWWTRTRHYIALHAEDAPDNQERRSQLYACIGFVVAMMTAELSVTGDIALAEKRVTQLDQLVALSASNGQLLCVWHAEPDNIMMRWFETAWAVMTGVDGEKHVRHQWSESCC